MEIKKSQTANIEKNRGTFFKIGIIFSLSFLLLAFEYKNSGLTENTLGEFSLVAEMEEDVIIIRQETPKPPKPKLIAVINIAPDEVELEEEMEIPDMEFEENEGIEVPELDVEPTEVLPFFLHEIQEKPEFPGGEEALARFLNKNVEYPEICKENGITGKVIVRFVVSKTGRVKDVEIAKHADRELEKEVIRVVNLMPKWKPGSQNTKPVSVYFHLPINFNLE